MSHQWQFSLEQTWPILKWEAALILLVLQLILQDGFKTTCSPNCLFTSLRKHVILNKDLIFFIFNGHYMIDLARENHVIVISLLSHSTHNLQPLNRTFIGPLKTYYIEVVRVWLQNNCHPLIFYMMIWRNFPKPIFVFKCLK